MPAAMTYFTFVVAVATMTTALTGCHGIGESHCRHRSHHCISGRKPNAACCVNGPGTIPISPVSPAGDGPRFHRHSSGPLLNRAHYGQRQLPRDEDRQTRRPVYPPMQPTPPQFPPSRAPLVTRPAPLGAVQEEHEIEPWPYSHQGAQGSRFEPPPAIPTATSPQPVTRHNLWRYQSAYFAPRTERADLTAGTTRISDVRIAPRLQAPPRQLEPNRQPATPIGQPQPIRNFD